jgi:putative membrane protein
MFGVAGRIPAWVPHPDVWLLVAAIGAGYAIAVARLGHRYVAPGRASVSRLQVVSFALGLATMWVAADWPVHDLAEHSMYSVHMLQHLMLTMVSAPLLLLGTPGWLIRYVLRPPSVVFRIVRTLCRFFPALLFASALIVWMPVVSPMPEIPRLAAPVRGAYLFLQSIVPTVPASFLTFGDTPLYKFYVGKPHLWGLSTLEDQQVAGLIMKIGGGTLLWALIAVVFFRWAADEDRRNQPQRARRELDQELTGLHAALR